MSIQWMNHGWQAGPPKAHHRYVYVCLGDNANDDGICWPSQETIARKTSLNLSSVKRILRELTGSGWISVLPGNGRGIRSTYQLHRTPKGEQTSSKGFISPPLIKGFIDAKKGVQKRKTPAPPYRKNHQLTIRSEGISSPPSEPWTDEQILSFWALQKLHAPKRFAVESPPDVRRRIESATPEEIYRWTTERTEA